MESQTPTVFNIGMLFLKFDGKDIPFEGAWQNPDYIAFLERVQADREKLEQKRNERLTVIATVVGVVIAFAAAGAGFWSGYEAHLTRVQDERPFVGIEITSFVRTEGNRPKRYDGRSLPDSVVGPPIQLRAIGYGKTPAHHIHIGCATTLFDWTQRPWRDLDLRPYTTLSYLIPSRSEYFRCGVQIPPNAKSSTPAKGFVVRALAEYEDESGRHYATPFCEDVFMESEQVERMEQCDDANRMPGMR